jgi:threonine dehydrogenase-like Zn-dependent dehydrogenase
LLVKALVVDKEAHDVRLEERPDPQPRPGEALVGVRMAGICGTDLELAQGYLDFGGVIGHEFVGRVEACDSAPEWVGRRVVAELNCACGECATCRRGLALHCERRTVLGIQGRDGALAERLAVPVANLHEVPAAVGDEHAVFTEPLAAALEVLEQVHVCPSHEVLLLGDGRIAQLVAQVLLLTGCELTACGRHEAKLALMRRRGARTVLAEELPERRFDVVVEATGRPDGPAQAVAHCRARGTVVLKTTVHGSAGVPAVPVVVDEITVVGSRCGPFQAALRLLEGGAIEVTQLISGIYPLPRAREAFAYARGREVLKVLVDAVHDGV